MRDRRQDAGMDDRTGSEQQRDEYGQEKYGQGQRAMTQERQRSDAERWSGSGGSAGTGDWQGYVVPYRYYGPGYRGVGYYSVMYQGSEGSGDEERWSEGQGGQAMTGTHQGRGGYAGRGPKGYQRSDERLRDEVSDRLMEDDDLDASGIEVQVRDGEVTLTGTVPERSMKRRAEECAERVMGVRDVMNQVRVGQQSTSTSRQSGRKAQSDSDGQSAANGQRQKASSSTR